MKINNTYLKKEELDLLRKYINKKNDILKKLLENNLIKKTIIDLNLMAYLNNIFKIENLNTINDNLLILQNNYIYDRLNKLKESLNKNNNKNILKLKQDLSKFMEKKKKNLPMVSNNNFLNKYYATVDRNSLKFIILIVLNIKNILKIYKKKEIKGGNLVNDNFGIIIGVYLDNLINEIKNPPLGGYMESNIYKEIIKKFIIEHNQTIKLRGISFDSVSLTLDSSSKAKKYWYLIYLNEVLKDIYDYKTNSRTIIDDFDSIDTSNKIKIYLDKMKEKHKNKVFPTSGTSNISVLTQHIRNTPVDDYMSLISDVNNILLNEIMKLWKEKEINKPLGTISPEIIRMMSDNVDNSVDSYYKSDLDEINNLFQSSINELDNINSFISTTHRPELLEVIESQGYLSGGYKLINMDL